MNREWRELAACAEVDPDLFFPVAVSGRVYAEQVAAAKRVCAVCPVQAECRAWASVALPDGVAGGLTPAERRGLNPDLELAGYDAPPGTQRERAMAGRAAIRAGRPVAEVAAGFGVSDRTAARWAADVRDEGASGEQEPAGRPARGRGAA